MSNIVAIVGRPNVGKSTFFNRLVERREAIMHNESGVTRDRHYGKSEWVGRPFTVIDTGGYVTGSEDIYEAAIREQVDLAIEEASAILFLVDAMAGLHGLDETFAQVLRKSKKPVFLVANKSDTHARAQDAAEFYSLGMGEVYPVSAQNGQGTGELLDALVAALPEEEERPEDDLPRIAVVGRPNAGKSSLVNALLGKERSIVTDQAGTTRDAVDARYQAFGKDFVLTDTAGIRKKGKVSENIEFYSVMRAVKAIERSDVCIGVIDATRGLEAQDVNIFGIALRANKGFCLMVNKWDLVEKKTDTAKEFRAAIEERFKPFVDFPVVFASATEKQRIFQTVEAALRVYDNAKRRIPTSKLNEALLPLIERNPPPSMKGRYVKIKYVTQLPARSVVFAFFCNHPKYVKEAYQRFLENRLREQFDFSGVPIKLVFRQK